MTTLQLPVRTGRRRNFRDLAFHQFRYDLRAFFRNRQSQFFTLALPVLFLVIFASVFGGDHTVKVAGGRIDTSVSYVPGIMTLGIIAAAFVNLVISVTAQRETGVLETTAGDARSGERPHRGAGAHRSRHRAGHHRVLLGDRLGRLRRARPRPHRPGTCAHHRRRRRSVLLPRLRRHVLHPRPRRRATRHPGGHAAAVLHLGRVRPDLDPAPLAHDVAAVFPVRHLAAALLTAYNPHTHGAGIATGDLLIVAAWGVAGLVVALRRFSWNPLGH